MSEREILDSPSIVDAISAYVRERVKNIRSDSIDVTFDRDNFPLGIAIIVKPKKAGAARIALMSMDLDEKTSRVAINFGVDSVTEIDFRRNGLTVDFIKDKIDILWNSIVTGNITETVWYLGNRIVHSSGTIRYENKNMVFKNYHGFGSFLFWLGNREVLNYQKWE
jgi:hypothetical protein